jgi:Tol biopolymer transport system component/tRNA A-37 threonylcarbamoyl transferase component Bud32
MGDVYRARDTRLDRTVAIKILKTEFSHRFDLEARAISALNHPHICSLHDIGQEGQTEYLVMEYVHGKPLACPMEVRQAIEFGAQIADALAAAHRQGIVHRDLKPANILVTREGVKLLDFGIASMRPQIPAFDQGVTTSRTIEGALVGTLEYMAPEQLEGRKADERTDIYAFGLVLYEMLTGLRAGEASSAAGVIAVVMSGPIPSVRTRRPEVPEELDRLIHRCLEKDPDRRWQSAEALREALRWLLASQGAQQAPAPASSAATRSWRSHLARAALFVLTAAACAAAGWLAASVSHRAPAGLSMVTDLDLPADLSVGFDSVFALAPDGTSVVFNSSQALWLRSLQNGTVRRLGGTAGGTFPFWSPSSRAIAFFADGHLQRLNLPDGSPVVLAPAPSPRGGAWSSRGVIVFAPSLGGPLLQVAEDGGATSAVTALDSSRQEVTHQFPSFVPGEDRFVFFAGSRVPQLSTVRMAALGSAGGPAPPISSQPFQNSAVVADTSEGTYLLSVRDSELVAQSFDINRGRVSGPARTLARRVRPQFSVMSNGAIVYIVDPDVRNQPVWVNREGGTIGPAGKVGSYQDLGLSRDQTKAAYVGAAEAGGVQGLWVLDLTTGSTTRLRIDGVPDDPTWSPDGRQIAISLKVESAREEDVYITDLARPDQPRRLLATPAARWPLDWSADGRILYAEIDPQTNYDIWVAAADGGGRPTAVVRGPAKDQGARFSPDGKWIAYQSNESGVSRVYVTDVSGGTGRTMPVSAGEGNRARWRADGREIFYQAPDRNLMVVPIEWSPAGPVPGTPRVLFKSSGRFEPAATGEKFLVLQDAATPDVARVHVLTGWQRTPPE